MRDTVKRHFRNWFGEKTWGTVRRLKCKNKDCGKIHRELPDKMVPYKHYQAECIEATLDEKEVQCGANDLTFSRWKSWYGWVKPLMAEWLLLAVRTIGDLVEMARRADETLQTLRARGGGWLAGAYLTTVNAGYPAYTPSLYLRGPDTVVE